VRDWLRENQYLIRAWVYIALTIPGVIWWRESVLFVILLSLGANIDTALGAHEAHKSRRENGNQQ
jgi:hypothetical protein